jgi:hypothetical protein
VGLAEAVDEVEAWAGDGVDHRFICVALGKSIDHRVGSTGLVLHREVEVEEFAHPLMLWYGGETLVE